MKKKLVSAVGGALGRKETSAPEVTAQEGTPQVPVPECRTLEGLVFQLLIGITMETLTLPEAQQKVRGFLAGLPPKEQQVAVSWVNFRLGRLRGSLATFVGFWHAGGGQ